MRVQPSTVAMTIATALMAAACLYGLAHPRSDLVLRLLLAGILVAVAGHWLDRWKPRRRK